MAVVVAAISFGVNHLDIDLKVKAILNILVCGGIGAYSYVFFASKIGIIKNTFGKNPIILDKILPRRKEKAA